MTEFNRVSAGDGSPFTVSDQRHVYYTGLNIPEPRGVPSAFGGVVHHPPSRGCEDTEHGGLPVGVFNLHLERVLPEIFGRDILEIVVVHDRLHIPATFHCLPPLRDRVS